MKPTPRTCVVTGGTSGIGRATVLALAREGWRLVVTGRDEGRGRSVAREALERGAAESVFLAADLANLQAVRALAEAVALVAPRIDALINNAGARFDRYGSTVDGFERTMATNHLGHYLLTLLLLEPLRSAEEARVVTLSSVAHRSALMDGCWMYDEPHFERRKAYAKSKLANTLFALELSRRANGLVSHSVDPGIVATRFALNNGWWPWMKHLVMSAAGRHLISAERAASTVVHAASAPELKGINGRHFCECREAAPSAAAGDPALAAELWRLSWEWCGIRPCDLDGRARALMQPG